MLKELEKLSASEIELMMKAPLLVCILIAGADSEIDKNEIKGAIGLAKKGKVIGSLAEYYKEVAEDFEDKLKVLLRALPKESSSRNQFVVEELSQLNLILPKMKKSVATDFYKSLRYIAKKIAETSGGVLGMKAVGEKEMQFLGLSMIMDPGSS